MDNAAVVKIFKPPGNAWNDNIPDFIQAEGFSGKTAVAEIGKNNKRVVSG